MVLRVGLALKILCNRSSGSSRHEHDVAIVEVVVVAVLKIIVLIITIFVFLVVAVVANICCYCQLAVIRYSLKRSSDGAIQRKRRRNQYICGYMAECRCVFIAYSEAISNNWPTTKAAA